MVQLAGTRRRGCERGARPQDWCFGCRWRGPFLVSLLTVALAAASRGPDPAPDSFVTRSGSRMSLAGRPYHFLGLNAYQLTAQAAGENDDGWPGDSGAVAAGRAAVERLLERAARLGLRVVRTWAFNHRLPGLNTSWLQQHTPASATANSSSSSSNSDGSSSYLDCLTDTNGGSGCAAGLPLVWEEAEFVGLDWVVARAEAAGVRLVLALGNLWPAYVGPERFLRAAQLLRPPGGAAAAGGGGGTAAAAADVVVGLSGRALVAADAEALARADGSASVADFYCHPGARKLYSEHIRRVTGRVNSFTGRKYSDTPAIMMWDVMNEPRCPGCSPAQLSCYSQWMRLVTDTAAAAAPRQLRAMGTEGFFADGAPQQQGGPDLAAAAGLLSGGGGGGAASLEDHNPGVGAVCEGEDWLAATQLPGSDVAVLHTYWRQTEGVPGCGWSRMTWWQYLPWYLHYTALHVRLAGALGRPLVQEEFNIISSRFTPQQRSQLFAAALWQLVASAEAGGPYAGALWWGGAVVGAGWDDGYTLFLDAAGAPSGPTPGLAASLFSPSGLAALLADPAAPSAKAAAAVQRAFEQQPPTACGPLGAGGAGVSVVSSVNVSTSSVVVRKEDVVAVVTSTSTSASVNLVTASAGPPPASGAAGTGSPSNATSISAAPPPTPSPSVEAALADTTAAIAATAAAAAAAGAAAATAAAAATPPAGGSPPLGPSPSVTASYQTYAGSGSSSGSNSGGSSGGSTPTTTTNSSPRRLLLMQPAARGAHQHWAQSAQTSAAAAAAAAAAEGAQAQGDNTACGDSGAGGGDGGGESARGNISAWGSTAASPDAHMHQPPPPQQQWRRRRRGRALQQVEVLDAFRRGGPRQQCAEARAAAGHQPAPPPALGADPGGTLTPPLPQLAALLAAAEGRHVLEVVAAAAERLNALWD